MDQAGDATLGIPVIEPSGIDASEEASPPNLVNLVTTSVTAMIRQRQLRGGHSIVEAKLAAQLGVSRTPLREGLQRLEGEGLVIKGSGRSFVVRHVDLGEYLQSLKVREILEPEAAEAAAGHIPDAEIAAVRREIAGLQAGSTSLHTDAHWQSDDALHELFARNSGNDVLAQVIRRLRVTTRLFEIARLQDRVAPDLREHAQILDALESGDGKAARKATQAHIRSLQRFALATVR
ncbi:GntR family transcriptional regulator [Methylobacterium terricola]|uniref:GntR family transcriptional regulator n=1 Tax=Methylobacterium terricola TaxID=2583531 RepID=A0A5C4LAX4_9HYPH|nr:GntR family transcriptional regulator [Methylobacterium terricola]